MAASTLGLRNKKTLSDRAGWTGLETVVKIRHPPPPPHKLFFFIQGVTSAKSLVHLSSSLDKELSNWSSPLYSLVRQRLVEIDASLVLNTTSVKRSRMLPVGECMFRPFVEETGRWRGRIDGLAGRYSNWFGAGSFRCTYQ
jgi:hypothetical protein